MKATVYCRTTERGIHTFYLNAGGEEYYLFRQNFRRSVSEYYRYGVMLDGALDKSKAKGNAALMHTMEKLPMYLRYIEREYDIRVLDKTIKKAKKYGGKSAA